MLGTGDIHDIKNQHLCISAKDSNLIGGLQLIQNRSAHVRRSLMTKMD